jgi:gluconolactonase
MRRLGLLSVSCLFAVACTERTPADQLLYDSGVYIADADERPSTRDASGDAEPDAEVDAGAGDLGAPDAEPLRTPTWVDDVQPIIAGACLSCHGATPIAGAPMPLVTYANVTAMYRSLRTPPEMAEVYRFVARAMSSTVAPMPSGGRLPPAQVDLVVRWAAAGAPERAPADAGVDGGGPDAQDLDGGAPDALADTGVAPDAVVFPDAAAPDAVVFPDAAAPDAMVFPDAAAPDAVVFPDAAAAAPDAVVFPDAAAPDAVVFADAAAPDAVVFPDAAAPDAEVFPDAAAPDAAAPDAAAPDAAAPDAGVLDPLVGVGAVTLVQAGYSFLEGPLWVPAEGALLFSDVGLGRVHRIAPPAASTVFRDPSGFANGMALDPQGRLVSCEHDTRGLTRGQVTGGPMTPLITTYQGQAFSSPNDVVIRSDGVIYFTDPPYGLGARPREIAFNGLFRAVITGTVVQVTAEWQGALTTRPNGVVFSADESRLFMADTAAGTITRFDVAAVSGALSNPTLFTTTAAGPDGMAIDVLGNLFVATSVGVQAYSSAGVLWGVIPVPRVPSNIAWGDADRRTLYITAEDRLYSVRVVNAGVRD